VARPVSATPPPTPPGIRTQTLAPTVLTPSSSAAAVLQSPAGSTRANHSSADDARGEWHAARRKGLGGSDVAAVMGVSPWNSAMDTWLSKMGMVEPNSETGAMQRGRLFEDAIAQWYQEEIGSEYVVEGGEEMPIGNPLVEEWMLASPDRYVTRVDGTEPKFGLEIKTARSDYGWGQKSEGNAGIPAYYLTQCAWYMAVTGIHKWVIVVYILASDEFRTYTINRDPEYERHMVETCRNFWNNHVIPGVPPPLDGSKGTQDYLKLVHGQVKDDEIAEATSKETEMILRLKELKDEYARVDREHGKLESEVKALIGERVGLKGPWGQVTWRQQTTRKRLDQTALAADHPNLVDQYTVGGYGIRVFRMEVK